MDTIEKSEYEKELENEVLVPYLKLLTYRVFKALLLTSKEELSKEE